MRKTRLLAATVAAALATTIVPSAPAGAAVTPEVEAAVAWLEDQQQADGGFELASFPGFETPDAVLALATAGQSGEVWDEAEARAAVEAVETEGNDALDALDAWVDSTHADPGATVATKGQQAAKLVSLVTVPLGLDATDFDPSDDSADPVDLVAAMTAAAGDGSYDGLPFGGRVAVAWALALLGEEVPAPLLAAIDGAQKANGGFDFDGNPSGDLFDIDVTAAVVLALLADDRPATDPTVRRAVTGLALRQEWTGEWAGGFDDGNPNSTALVALVARTLGQDPDSGCWRAAAEPRVAGLPLRAPTRALTARQQPDGRISSPDDGWGINTFATTQAIQALASADGAWPYGSASAACPVTPPSRRVVNAFYLDLLGRLSDEAGAAYWAGQIDGELTTTQVARRFTVTSEYGGTVVDGLARAHLGRPATTAERSAGGPEVVAGRRLVVAAGILGSQEFYDSTAPPFSDDPATDATWTQGLYQAALGRGAGVGEVTWIESRLAAGAARADVAYEVLRSPEGRAHLVRTTYQDLLRRNPGAGERTYWGDQLGGGLSPERMVMFVAGSPEYVASTTV